MYKSNLIDENMYPITLALIVKDGVDTGIGGKYPGYLINKLEDVLEEFMEYDRKEYNNENKI